MKLKLRNISPIEEELSRLCLDDFFYKGKDNLVDSGDGTSSPNSRDVVKQLVVKQEFLINELNDLKLFIYQK